MARYFEYRHVVGYAETNLVGNVYYVHYLHWQGRCREMFLRAHCPTINQELAEDLALVTVRCSCDYLSELFAFNEVSVRMRLGKIAQNRVLMLFEYRRVDEDGGEELVARGEQMIACMRRQDDGRTVPTQIPQELKDALEAYR